MNISVVIITKDRPLELEDCLKSIENQSLLPDEVIIVDSSTTDVSEITKKYNSLNIVCFSSFEGGTSKARNYGIEHANADIIAFIDDDVLLPPEYMKEITSYFAKNKDVGAITGPTYDLSDIYNGISSEFEMNNLLLKNDPFYVQVVKEIESHFQVSFNFLYKRYSKNKAKRFVIKIIRSFFFLDSFKMGKMLPSGFGSTFCPLSKPYQIERLHGCNMAFRKKVLTEFNFNENLEKTSNYAIYEDHELGYRISRKYNVLMVPTVFLCHRKTPTSRVDFLNYYDAIATNVYCIVETDLGGRINKIAFLWSTIGAICALFVTYIAIPTKENKDKLTGFIRGIRRIFRSWLHMYKHPF